MCACLPTQLLPRDEQERVVFVQVLVELDGELGDQLGCFLDFLWMTKKDSKRLRFPSRASRQRWGFRSGLGFQMSDRVLKRDEEFPIWARISHYGLNPGVGF